MAATLPTSRCCTCTCSTHTITRRRPAPAPPDHPVIIANGHLVDFDRLLATAAHRPLAPQEIAMLRLGLIDPSRLTIEAAIADARWERAG